jgi:putative ABC transport system substrate-binding protein
MGMVLVACFAARAARFAAVTITSTWRRTSSAARLGNCSTFPSAPRGSITRFGLRPGGNITGLTLALDSAIDGKQLELLKETAPRISRVAVIYRTPGAPGSVGQPFPVVFREVDTAARALGVMLIPIILDGADRLAGALAMMTRERADALLAVDTNPNFRLRREIADFAMRSRFPLMGTFREMTDARGLVSYGASVLDLFRRAATYVDRILKGAKPADLPVEQPTTFELVINRASSKG